MTKHILRWANTNCIYAGKKSSLAFANEIDRYYSGTLLSRVLRMKKQKPISLNNAILHMIKYKDAAYDAGRKGTELGEHGWYQTHFIDWLTDLGFHIELTGDEFEPSVFSNQII